MPKFFCIVTDINKLRNPDTFRLLQGAVEERGWEYVPLDAVICDPATVPVEEGDVLYRLGVSDEAKFLEGVLCARSPARTLYRGRFGVFGRAFPWSSTLRLEADRNLPVIPTRFCPQRISEDELNQAVEALGGFPLVIKGAGGSHGSAVRKASTMNELKSMLASAGGENLVLRRFIHDARHIRVVVVGDHAVDAIEYHPQPGDFRTNAVEVPSVSGVSLDTIPNVRRVAERAVRQTGVEFGGVDILMQPNGDFFVAEVNFPCNFARNQMETGTDIAGAIVDHLIKKG